MFDACLSTRSRDGSLDTTLEPSLDVFLNEDNDLETAYDQQVATETHSSACPAAFSLFS